MMPRAHAAPQAEIELGPPLAAGGQGSVRRGARRADGRALAVKTVDTSRLGAYDAALPWREAQARRCLSLHPIAARGRRPRGRCAAAPSSARPSTRHTHAHAPSRQALAALGHPNVIAFEGLYQEGPLLHIVTEWADGGDLLSAVKRAAAGGGHLPEDQIMDWLVQVGGSWG